MLVRVMILFVVIFFLTTSAGSLWITLLVVLAGLALLLLRNFVEIAKDA